MKGNFTIIFCIFSIKLFSQNLIPNYSFENTTCCPTNGNEIYIGCLPPWFSPTQGTPDYYNQCNSFAFSVPLNSVGYQVAKTGVAYAGIQAFGGLNGREYIEARLSDSLVAGKKYVVTFYVSLADSSKNAVDGFGAYLSIDSIKANINTNLQYTPQVKNPPGNFLADKFNWMKIYDTIMAVGGEKYITVGNFYNDSNTNILFVGGGTWSASYYYVDNVSVISLDSLQGINELQQTLAVKAHPNPSTGMFDIETDMKNENYKVKIFNVLGNVIYNGTLNDSKFKIDLFQEPKGIYFMRIQTNELSRTIKLIVE